MCIQKYPNSVKMKVKSILVRSEYVFFAPRKYFVVTLNLVTLVVISIYHWIYRFAPSIKKKRALKPKAGVKAWPSWLVLKGPREITKNTYGSEKTNKDPYWNKRTRQNTALFADRLIDEPNYTNIRGIKTNTVTFKNLRPRK